MLLATLQAPPSVIPLEHQPVPCESTLFCYSACMVTALPCPALPCPALPCPALPCPALPCPAERDSKNLTGFVDLLCTLCVCSLAVTSKRCRTGSKPSVEKFEPHGWAWVCNIVGTTQDKFRGLKRWEEEVKQDRTDVMCCNAYCPKIGAYGPKNSIVGGHLWLHGQSDPGHAYLAPLCQWCNKQTYWHHPVQGNSGAEQPSETHWFLLKEHVPLIKFESHACFSLPSFQPPAGANALGGAHG